MRVILDGERLDPPKFDINSCKCLDGYYSDETSEIHHC